MEIENFPVDRPLGLMPLNPRWEPHIAPGTTRLMLGNIAIAPTSTLSALLYGFMAATDIDQREYYYWRICDEFWNTDANTDRHLMVRNPWSMRMIRAALEEKWLAVGGAASSTKSHSFAGYAIVNWMAYPGHTQVALTSISLKEARKRIWGSIITLLQPLAEFMPGVIRDSIGNVAYVNEKGELNSRFGISLIAAAKGRTREAVGDLVGLKAKRFILIADELSELSPAIMATAKSNLTKNPFLQAIALSNPASRFDAFGEFSTPEDGWDAVNILTDDQWRTKVGGLYIRLDGERSPNILAKQDIYPFMYRNQNLQEDRQLGETSRAYMRMVRAVFFDSAETEGIYTEAEITQSGCMGRVKWQSKPTLLAGLDPAFTNEGDRCVLYTARIGYDEHGQYVLEFDEAIQLNDDSTNTAVPRTYQIARQVRTVCEKRGIRAVNLAVDSTSAGSPFCDVLAGEWSNDFLRVPFGGSASERRVSANSTLVGNELYCNRVSEIWFVGKEFMRTRQLFGVSTELAREMTARRYDMVKGANLRMKVEPKPEFKSRFGRSPDLADAAFLVLDLARQRFGLVSVDARKPEDGNGGQPAWQSPRTFQSMSRALENPAAALAPC